jgi:hypothetical protein
MRRVSVGQGCFFLARRDVCSDAVVEVARTQPREAREAPLLELLPTNAPQIARRGEDLVEELFGVGLGVASPEGELVVHPIETSLVPGAIGVCREAAGDGTLLQGLQEQAMELPVRLRLAQGLHRPCDRVSIR